MASGPDGHGRCRPAARLGLSATSRQATSLGASRPDASALEPEGLSQNGYGHHMLCMQVYDMAGCAALRYAMIWYDMWWYATVCHVMACNNILGYVMVWHVMTCYEVMWHGMIWVDMMWCHTLWYGVLWLWRMLRITIHMHTYMHTICYMSCGEWYLIRGICYMIDAISYDMIWCCMIMWFAMLRCVTL